MTDPILCARCGGDNPADAQFCIDCGATLASASTGPTTRLAGVPCASCRSLNPAESLFCTSCGRSLAGRAAPQPRPAPMPPRQAYPRTATPPVLLPHQAQPPSAPHAPHAPHTMRGNPAPFVFLVGLVVLLVNGMLWPGILILLGVSLLVSQSSRGRPDRAVGGMIWLVGLAVLFGTGKFWPGIIVLWLIHAAVTGWGRSRRYPW